MSLKIDHKQHKKKILLLLVGSDQFSSSGFLCLNVSCGKSKTVNDKLVTGDVLKLRNCTTAKTSNVWAKAFYNLSTYFRYFIISTASKFICKGPSNNVLVLPFANPLRSYN